MSQAPVRVSPLIKFGRWSLLLVGIAYGAAHQSRLSKKEEKLREIEAQQKAVRDAKLAEEKKRSAEAEARALAELSKPSQPFSCSPWPSAPAALLPHRIRNSWMKSSAP